MTSIIQQQCPLCSINSQYELIDHRNLKYFSCPNCNKFAISIDAETRLLKSINQWCSALSDKAKLSDSENVFVITLASTTPRQEGLAYPVLNGEFIARKELLR